MNTITEWIQERRRVVTDGTADELVHDVLWNAPNAWTAVEEVLELHAPEFFGTKYVADREPVERYVCMECEMHAPCPTVEAIRTALNIKEDEEQ